MAILIEPGVFSFVFGYGGLLWIKSKVDAHPWHGAEKTLIRSSNARVLSSPGYARSYCRLDIGQREFAAICCDTSCLAALPRCGLQN